MCWCSCPIVRSPLSWSYALKSSQLVRGEDSKCSTGFCIMVMISKFPKGSKGLMWLLKVGTDNVYFVLDCVPKITKSKLAIVASLLVEKLSSNESCLSDQSNKLETTSRTNGEPKHISLYAITMACLFESAIFHRVCTAMQLPGRFIARERSCPPRRFESGATWLMFVARSIYCPQPRTVSY